MESDAHGEKGHYLTDPGRTRQRGEYSNNGGEERPRSVKHGLPEDHVCRASVSLRNTIDLQPDVEALYILDFLFECESRSPRSPSVIILSHSELSVITRPARQRSRTELVLRSSVGRTCAEASRPSRSTIRDATHRIQHPSTASSASSSETLNTFLPTTTTNSAS